MDQSNVSKILKDLVKLNILNYKCGITNYKGKETPVYKFTESFLAEFDRYCKGSIKVVESENVNLKEKYSKKVNEFKPSKEITTDSTEITQELNPITEKVEMSQETINDCDTISQEKIQKLRNYTQEDFIEEAVESLKISQSYTSSDKVADNKIDIEKLVKNNEAKNVYSKASDYRKEILDKSVEYTTSGKDTTDKNLINIEKLLEETREKASKGSKPSKGFDPKNYSI